jgi:hypothetical protein
MTSKHQQAPTICVEGTDNSHGSHGLIHKTLAELMAKKPENISLNDAIDEGAKSVRIVFPESACSEKCLKAQLKDFYDKLGCPSVGSNPGTGGASQGNKDGGKI